LIVLPKTSNLKMKLRLFDFMTEEYFLCEVGSIFIEEESSEVYISALFNYTFFNYTRGSVWAAAPILLEIKFEGFIVYIFVYLFLIGWRPSWYWSGRNELTLLISKNLMFLDGLLKLIYLPYLAPFLETLMGLV